MYSDSAKCNDMYGTISTSVGRSHLYSPAGPRAELMTETA